MVIGLHLLSMSLYYWCGPWTVIFMVLFPLIVVSEMDAVSEQEGLKADVWKIMTNEPCQFSLFVYLSLCSGNRRVLLSNSSVLN